MSGQQYFWIIFPSNMVFLYQSLTLLKLEERPVTLKANLDESFDNFRRSVIESFEKNLAIVCNTGSKLMFHDVLLQSFSRYFNTSSEYFSGIDGGSRKAEVVALSMDVNGLQSLYDLIYIGDCLVEMGQLAGLISQLAFIRPGLVRLVTDEERQRSLKKGLESRELREDPQSKPEDKPSFENVKSVMYQRFPKLNEKNFNIVQCIADRIESILPRSFYDLRFLKASKGYYHCLLCSRLLKSVKTWRSHLMAVHYSRAFKCPNCSKVLKVIQRHRCKQGQNSSSSASRLKGSLRSTKKTHALGTNRNRKCRTIKDEKQFH